MAQEYSNPRVLLLPILFAVAVWSVVFSDKSEAITAKCIDPTNLAYGIYRVITFQKTPSIIEEIHIDRLGLVESFNFGVLYEKYQEEGFDKAEILKEATDLVGLKTRQIDVQEFKDSFD